MEEEVQQMSMQTNMSLVIASDHAGFAFKEMVKSHLVESLGLDVIDLGPESAERCDYPDFAARVARYVQGDSESRGILICGSGIGMSMTVNRFSNVRGALVHNGLAARLSRQHNDANVLCLGARLIGIEVAKDAIAGFLQTPFEGGRHQGRVEKIDEVTVDS